MTEIYSQELTEMPFTEWHKQQLDLQFQSSGLDYGKIM